MPLMLIAAPTPNRIQRSRERLRLRQAFLRCPVEVNPDDGNAAPLGAHAHFDLEARARFVPVRQPMVLHARHR